MEIEQHNFQKLYKGIPWLVCAKCGLVALRNPFTKWCMSNGCNHSEHPNYRAIMKQLTKNQ